MTTLAPAPLSGSTDGRGIKVTGTNTSGSVTVHTAASGATYCDYVTLYAVNTDTVPIVLTVEWGGTNDPDDTIVTTIPAKAGLVPVAVNLPLRNNLAVKAFAGTANKVILFGSRTREAA